MVFITNKISYVWSTDRKIWWGFFFFFAFWVLMQNGSINLVKGWVSSACTEGMSVKAGGLWRQRDVPFHLEETHSKVTGCPLHCLQEHLLKSFLPWDRCLFLPRLPKTALLGKAPERKGQALMTWNPFDKWRCKALKIKNSIPPTGLWEPFLPFLVPLKILPSQIKHVLPWKPHCLS